MTNDLAASIRRIVDVAEPVSTLDVMTYAMTSRVDSDSFETRTEKTTRPHVHVRPLVAVAVSVLVLGALAVVVVVGTSGRDTGRSGVTPPPAHVILTAAEVRTITSHSNAADSSGTAEVTETSAQNGVPQDGYDLAVTFSGPNIDERISPIPEPPGSATPFVTDDRWVDGQFYIYTPGPNDVPEWLHDTDSTNDAASMQFPDPRTLYQAISPAAEFATQGTAMMNGETVTHLVAINPAAINASALGNLAADATLTSFQIWVDPNDIVQQVALSTAQTSRACTLGPLAKSALETLLPEYKAQLSNGKEIVKFPASASASLKKAIRSLASCGPLRTTSNVTVAFADLGVAQSVTAPSSAVNYAGKG